MESSSGKIRQSSYNHAASPRQDPPASGRKKALAPPVRAARRAEQGWPARARRAAADRARAHTGGPCEQDGGARGGRGAARRGPGGDSPGRGCLCFRGTAARAVPHRSRAHAVARRSPQRDGAAPRGRDRVGRPRRRARLARSGTRHRRRPGRDRSRCRRRQDRSRRGPGAAPRHRRGDRQRRVPALSPVHRPAPDPAPHGERAARADGRPARLPRPDPGRASQDLPGDREPRSERGARCYAPPPHPLARALPTPSGATQSSVVVRILLTHSPEALALYYGERALKGLQNLGEVRLHEGKEPLQGEQLIRAAENCEMIVSYRQSPGPAEIFQRLPKLAAFVRCAIDIRNIDVAAASKAGVLVTKPALACVTSTPALLAARSISATSTSPRRARRACSSRRRAPASSRRWPRWCSDSWWISLAASRARRWTTARGGVRARRWERSCAAARAASSATAPSARKFPGWGKLSGCGCWSTIIT